MKQVWKCAHCSRTDESMRMMYEHEKRCSYNSEVKDCGTCANHQRVPFEQAWTCRFGWGFEDEKTLPCKKWELEDD